MHDEGYVQFDSTARTDWEKCRETTCMREGWFEMLRVTLHLFECLQHI